MQKWVVICWAALALVGADVCPDGGRCKEGETCCNSPSNGFGCCPYKNAECCDDHVHCCPAGTVCNTASSGCMNATVTIPWVQRTSADQPTLSKSFRMIKTYMGEEDDNICPDLSRCPAEFSCLKGLTKYGCCPLAQGIACPDGKHCCRKDHHCSADSRACVRNELVSTVLCSDGVSECPDGTTCCETEEGKWACCPLPKAVCCDDKIHCCPEETTCDVEHSKCIHSSTKKDMPMWAKLPARLRAEWENQKEGKQVAAKAVNNTETENAPKVATANPLLSSGNNVPCNETAACPDGTTCCKTKEGGWACCPLPEAVCCEDFVHCCPKGKKCNLEAQTCEDGLLSVPWVKKVPAIIKQEVQVKVVPCDDTVGCPDGTTCCKTKEGAWACCPLPEAVCCEDFIHCCPKGKKCNLAAQTCEDGLLSVPWVKKVPAIIKQEVQVKDVPCDDTVGCPDGTTCCKTKEGAWGCCPLPEAVCCEDFEHCCPKGKKCNLAAETCEDGLLSVPWVKKVPAIIKQEVQVKVVPCDDTVGCPDGTTCCKTKEGAWACCPLPEAVCCEDFIHCCPKGKKCNLEAQTCEDGLLSVPWVKKVPAIIKQEVQVKDVPCDDTVGCPDGTTCCKTKEGAWACCPLPEAVCCEDFEHCCPKGKKCNLAAETCEDGLLSVPWVKKVPAIIKQEVQVKVVPCDGTTSCPDGTTCCKTKAGGWACCPLPEAVCCDDHEHCCPKDTTCDLATLTCQGPSGSTPMHQKVTAFTTAAPTTLEPTTMSPVTSSNQEEEENKEEEAEEEENKDQEEGMIQCDPHTSCPQSTTCCYMTVFKKWGCCPLPEAVCCADGSHCCPQQYKCDESRTSCIKGEVVIPWYTKIPATINIEAEPTSVPCDSASQCPEQTTCCQLFTGEWGCCPLKNAVCCPDKEHCCPQGYTCDVLSRSCQKLIMMQLESVPLTPVYLPEPQPQLSPVKHKHIKCDDQNSCAADETCCRTSATSWGCCPSPNAVCCSNMKHCCQFGYTCTDEGSCIQNSRLYWPNWHVFLTNKKRALIV